MYFTSGGSSNASDPDHILEFWKKSAKENKLLTVSADLPAEKLAQKFRKVT